MKFTLTLLITFIVALSSCGIHIEKRLYRNGFYIISSKHRQAEDVTTGESVSGMQYASASVAPDTSIDETDRISTTTENKDVATAAVPVPADTIHTDNERQPVNETSVTERKQESPPDEVPAAEMESIRQLYIASIAVLVAWLILSPLSTIASLVLALIVLKRIRMLKAMYSPTENQQVQLEKYRSFEVITLTASIVVLGLTILVLALFLAFFFGALTFGFI